MGRAGDLKRQLEECGIPLPLGCLEVTDLEELLVRAKSQRREKEVEPGSQRREKEVEPGSQRREEEVEPDDLADVSTDEEDFDHSQESQEGDAEDAAVAASIVTWNCQSAAPARPSENMHKLRRTIDLLERELGGLPDAIALQETLFKDEAQLIFAQAATAEYTWLCSPGKKRPVQEYKTKVDPGRGNWLLIRKGGPLAGGSVLDLGEWDDQHRVVAVNTPLGLLVSYYGPACTGPAARERGDGPRYRTNFSSFLKQHKDELLAVVGDLNMTFDPFDFARPDEHGVLVPLEDQLRDFVSERALLDDAGLVDAWRHHHPHAREYSRKNEKWLNDGWARVDHVLVPARRVEATTAAILTSIKPFEKGRSSDHVPVCVQFI